MSDDKLFKLMKFQLLTFAFSEIGQHKITDAYLYAWDNSVYPLMDSAAHWHDEYEEYFEVSKDMLTELSNFLDDKWMKKEPIPSSYESEDHYNVRMGNSEWDRYKLIHALRYMKLHRLFDDPFWEAIMKNCPSEAHSIIDDFDREQDIYFQ